MRASRSGYLDEIAETDAQGAVATVYADIRRVFGVPFVMLVYRALATDPARLERVWSDLAPNVADLVRRGSRETDVPPVEGVVPLPGGSPAVSRLDPDRARSTLAAYHRANSANVVALHALLHGAAGPTMTSPARACADPTGPVLPMATLDGLAPAARRALEALSKPIAGAKQPIVVPSLLRHFAIDDLLPTALWTALRPALLGPDFGPAFDRVDARASELSATLPFGVRRVDDPPTRALLTRFARTIPAMIVAGVLIARALEDVLDEGS